VYECATCHRQESVTAGTVFHRTGTDLAKWFLAAYLMGRDKRGVSAKFLQRELGVTYQTAWTMAHKLRHGLSEDPARPLHGLSRSRRHLHRRPRRSHQSRPQHQEPR
jgi:transposase-like protein